MAAGRCLLASTAAVCLFAAEGERRRAPSYSAASVVNAFSNAAVPLAPYTIGTIYGTDLAYASKAAVLSDDRLPDVLEGVRVIIGNSAAPLYYVSPRQVNFVVPYTTGAQILFPSEVSLSVVVNGVAGPALKLRLNGTSPALFQRDPEMVTATHSDWSEVTPDSPARPGEDIVMFATGLGRTTPNMELFAVPKQAAAIQAKDLQVLLDGAAVPGDRIAYAGVAPGFAGLYQVNLRLPDELGKDPEVRISVGGETSSAGLRLRCAPIPPQQTSARVRLIQ